MKRIWIVLFSALFSLLMINLPENVNADYGDGVIFYFEDKTIAPNETANINLRIETNGERFDYTAIVNVASTFRGFKINSISLGGVAQGATLSTGPNFDSLDISGKTISSDGVLAIINVTAPGTEKTYQLYPAVNALTYGTDGPRYDVRLATINVKGSGGSSEPINPPNPVDPDPATYTISYNANGGTGAPASQTKTEGRALTLSSTAPTRSGYTFLGWSESSSASSATYTAGGSFTKDANTQLYAVWKDDTPAPVACTVTYNVNGGTGSITASSGNAGDTIKLSTTTPTRTGYDFLGWSTSSNGNVSYASGADYTLSSNVTLYAVWRVQEYEVSYNMNGGSGTISSTNGNYGSTIKISSTIPSKTGYTFSGWSTSLTGSTVYSSGADFTVPANNTTLYAIWSANSYLVDYNVNGGSGSISSISGNYGNSVSLSTTVPTRTGYTFLGWSTSATGSVEYAAGTSFAIPANNTTLYAVWSINSYSVNYNVNGGTGSITATTGNYGSTIIITSSVPTRSDYTFVGWSTSASGNVNYRSGDSYIVPANNITLYAIWQKTEVPVVVPNEYIITYNTNGGTGTIQSTKETEGTKVNLSSSIPTRTGYSFKGWSTTATGSVNYASGAEYTITANVTLYAVWEINSYSVSYNANGGTGTIAASSGNYGSTIKITSTSPTRSGYTFVGWSTAASGNINYKSGADYVVPANDITLYALWQKDADPVVIPNEYILSYDMNGGTGTIASVTATEGTDLKITTSSPTRTGYTFKGWSTTSNGSVNYASGADYKLNSNATLYAVWEVNSYSVSYNTNGGTGSITATTGNYGTSVKLTTSIPTRTGYTFLGWSTSASGSVNYKSGADFAVPANNTTLYAVWQKNADPTVVPNEYIIIYNVNGGNGSISSTKAIEGTTVKITSEAPTRTGYTFKGWSTTSTGSVNYASGADYKLTSNVTLYAVWQINSYSVSYNANGGSGTIASTSGNYGSAIKIATGEPTRSGYTFQGWSTTSTGSVNYTAGSDYIVPANNITLYAVWKAVAQPTPSNPTPSNPTPSNPTPSNPAPSNPTPTNPTPSTPSLTNPFKDVKNGKYYTESILYLNSKGVMTGLNSTTFGFNRLLTREDMVTLLWKNEGKPNITFSGNIFKDVPSGKYYSSAVAWAKKYNIVSGYSGAKAGYFGKGDNITRQDFVKIIYGYAIYKKYDVSVKSANSYKEKSDASSVAKYARESVNWAYENGLIGNGSPLNPKKNITRQDAAVIIARFLKTYNK